jgi:hypothetical protein
LGYTHRDLKPENIVINVSEEMKVALIDFDRSLPNCTECRTEPRGTPGYYPNHENWNDGHTMWNVYDLTVIILEMDMPKDALIKAKDEKNVALL